MGDIDATVTEPLCVIIELWAAESPPSSFSKSWTSQRSSREAANNSGNAHVQHNNSSLSVSHHSFSSCPSFENALQQCSWHLCLTLRRRDQGIMLVLLLCSHLCCQAFAVSLAAAISRHRASTQAPERVLRFTVTVRVCAWPQQQVWLWECKQVEATLRLS